MYLFVTELLTCRGTELYMSPEMASVTMQANMDRADVYALGVVLLDMFTLKAKWCPGRSALTGVFPTRTLLHESWCDARFIHDHMLEPGARILSCIT